MNIYTTMLALSAVAMLIAVVLLVLELSALDWDSSARTISSREPNPSPVVRRISHWA